MNRLKKEPNVPTERFRRKAESNPYYKLARQLVTSDAELINDLIGVRKHRKMSQGQLADTMGVTQSAIARFESGERNASQATIRRYALAVGACVTHTVRPQEETPHLLEDLSARTEWKSAVTSRDAWVVPANG